MSHVRLRTAGVEDAADVTAVYLATRREMRYLPVLHTDEDTAEHFAGVVRTAHVELAERAGETVGFAAVRGSWLEHLNVRPDAQSAGVGSRLMEWVKTFLPTGIDLWVFQENTRARAFYGSHGFRVVGLTDGAHNEEKQPDAHMRWEPAD
ncbi:MAG TPA: GNAT family N-acetyltransferase [Acidimicrobiales bacterium]|nr:GNAT family N-acetyltransferase [Acidimicrobiales bacterium]